MTILSDTKEMDIDVGDVFKLAAEKDKTRYMKLYFVHAQLLEKIKQKKQHLQFTRLQIESPRTRLTESIHCDTSKHSKNRFCKFTRSNL